MLTKKGYKQSPTCEGADLIIVLVCSVRQKSVDRAMNQIKNLKLKMKNHPSSSLSSNSGRYGAGNPKSKIIVAGCVLKTDRKVFKNLGAEIKTFKDLEKFPPARNASQRACLRSDAGGPVSGLITIGKGCDNFCSYCVVPYTRGREKYRSQTAIIKEATGLIKKGIKEITLVAQNVNSYPNFVRLLQKVTALPGDFTVKFITNHPKDFSDKLIDEMAKNPKIIKYIHLPFQAGDNAILRKMNRHYTRQDYLKLIAKIKKRIPDVVITTDIIVGFPGETKKQFSKTLEVMKKVHFKQAFIAKYSPRQGTTAFRLKDNVPLEEKALREQELRKILILKIR